MWRVYDNSHLEMKFDHVMRLSKASSVIDVINFNVNFYLFCCDSTVLEFSEEYIL